jgi:FkbM family methyltransferase
MATGGPLVSLITSANAAIPGFIKTIVDGGAGIGGSIVPLLASSPAIKVIAYEPLRENAKVLRQRFSGNPAVKVREVAISDRIGHAHFDIPSRLQGDGGPWTAGTSYNGYLCKAGLRSFLRRLAARMVRPGRSRETIKVSTVRLDSDLSAAPDVVKLDLQGGEPAALDGLGDYLRQVKLVKAEVQMLGGDARGRCVRKLQEFGFTIYLADLQFSVPELDASLRTALTANGVKIEEELRGSPYDPQTMVKGEWTDDQELPFQDLDLKPEFEGLLRAAKAQYFQVDLVALNQAHAESWNTILPSLRL